MAISVWKKIIAGGDRKSRLHDEQGTLISASRLIRNGPKALVALAGRLALGRRGVVPWISYDARRRIGVFLDPGKRVLEFGSGMSTAWYAARSKEVLSVEDYKPWYDKVAAVFKQRGIANVHYKFAADEAAYLTLSPEERGDGFDFIMIDGSHRDRCAEVAVEALRPGGWIYMDNADKGAESGISGDCDAARKTLLRFAEKTGGTVEWFTDFSPTQFFAQTGLLVRT